MPRGGKRPGAGRPRGPVLSESQVKTYQVDGIAVRSIQLWRHVKGSRSDSEAVRQMLLFAGQAVARELKAK